MQRDAVLGMDIGGTNLRCGLLDGENVLSHLEVVSSREWLLREDPLERLCLFLRGYLERNGEGGRPQAAALGFPSTVDRQRRRVLSTPNVASLQNLAVSDRLEQELGIPVYVNRDTNFLLLHDMLALGIEEEALTLGVYIGTGLGNAISIGGRLLTGRHGVEGELGHIPLPGNTRLCGCGNIGCAETLAGGNYLERLQRESYPDTPIGELFLRHGEEAPLREYVDLVSLPVATEVNIFDPDYVVLGGGVLQMPGFPIPLLEERIRLHTRKPLPAQTLRLRYAPPGPENGVIGAGLYARRRLQEAAGRSGASHENGRDSQ